MLDFVTGHTLPIQAACIALAVLVLAPLGALHSARAYAWTVRRSRELHGEICQCVYCDQITELRQRIDRLETELAELHSVRHTDWRSATSSPGTAA
jgi:hypothetical protein